MRRKPFRSKKKRLINKQCKGKGVLFFLRHYLNTDLNHMPFARYAVSGHEEIFYPEFAMFKDIKFESQDIDKWKHSGPKQRRLIKISKSKNHN